MKTYSSKLKSPEWQKRRLEILSRDNFTCQLCTDATTELQVHHKKYNGEPHESPSEDLITLCKHCHEIETIYNKQSDSLIISIKMDNEYYGRLKSGKLIICKILDDDNLSKGVIINKPKIFNEIIKSMF